MGAGRKYKNRMDENVRTIISAYRIYDIDRLGAGAVPPRPGHYSQAYLVLTYPFHLKHRFDFWTRICTCRPIPKKNNGEKTAGDWSVSTANPRIWGGMGGCAIQLNSASVQIKDHMRLLTTRVENNRGSRPLFYHSVSLARSLTRRKSHVTLELHKRVKRAIPSSERKSFAASHHPCQQCSPSAPSPLPAFVACKQPPPLANRLSVISAFHHHLHRHRDDHICCSRQH